MEEMVLSIRQAIESDIDDILTMMEVFAQELGVPKFKATKDLLIKAGINGSGNFDILVAASDELVAGYVITTPAYSSTHGAIGLYVEDLYVRKDMRAVGIGLVLIRETAKRAAEKGGTFLRWDADIENLNAIDFYQKIGGERETENTLMQLSGDNFSRFIRTQ